MFAILKTNKEKVNVYPQYTDIDGITWYWIPGTGTVPETWFSEIDD